MKKLFTLLELIIVIAVIAILMSLLLPSLTKSKEKAKIIMCLAQLKQLGLTQTLYCTNNSGKFPPTLIDGRKHAWNWAGKTADGPKLNDRPLNKYFGKFDNDDEMLMLRCPSDESPDHTLKSSLGGGKYSWYRAYGSSYAINKREYSALGHGIDRGWPSGPMNIASVSEPSRMVMAYENDGDTAVHISAWWAGFYGTLDKSTENGWAVIDMHPSMKGCLSNTIFVDGSARAQLEYFYEVYDTEEYTLKDAR